MELDTWGNKERTKSGIEKRVVGMCGWGRCRRGWMESSPAQPLASEMAMIKTSFHSNPHTLILTFCLMKTKLQIDL